MIEKELEEHHSFETKRMKNAFEMKLRDAQDLNKTNPNVITQIEKPYVHLKQLETVLKKEINERIKFKSFHERQTSVYHNNIRKLENKLNEKAYENISLKDELSDVQKNGSKYYLTKFVNLLLILIRLTEIKNFSLERKKKPSSYC